MHFQLAFGFEVFLCESQCRNRKRRKKYFIRWRFKGHRDEDTNYLMFAYRNYLFEIHKSAKGECLNFAMNKNVNVCHKKYGL